MGDADTRLSADWWRALDGDAELLGHLSVSGPRGVLPSGYDVTELAVTAVGVATLAVAELSAERRGAAMAGASVDRREASAAFRSEALLTPSGWTLPPVWDPGAGGHAAADGWTRLHTNYAHHRSAALQALGLSADADRAAVARAVAERDATE